jgi:hypothetical protein
LTQEKVLEEVLEEVPGMAGRTGGGGRCRGMSYSYTEVAPVVREHVAQLVTCHVTFHVRDHAEYHERDRVGDLVGDHVTWHGR